MGQSRLESYRQNHSLPLRLTTLGIIRKDDQICLAMKKRGFGAGKWNFAGGKVAGGETPPDCLIRETQEEFRTDIDGLKPVAILYFYFSDVPPEKNWNQKCYVFEAITWRGEPAESEEMAPKWWPQNKIPYDQMWPADREWLEPVLNNQKVTGYFLFTAAQECLETKILTGQLIDE